MKLAIFLLIFSCSAFAERVTKNDLSGEIRLLDVPCDTGQPYKDEKLKKATATTIIDGEQKLQVACYFDSVPQDENHKAVEAYTKLKGDNVRIFGIVHVIDDKGVMYDTPSYEFEEVE